MNAMEKAAWFQLIVVVIALLAVLILIPWLGQGAAGAFGLMGVLGFAGLFLRPRGKEVVIDERDREIEKRAMQLGFIASWQVLLFSLIGFVLWSARFNEGVVPAVCLMWLVFLQGAICIGVKGLVSVLAYRRQRHAS